jgi:hypothetical protein
VGMGIFSLRSVRLACYRISKTSLLTLFFHMALCLLVWDRLVVGSGMCRGGVAGRMIHSEKLNEQDYKLVEGSQGWPIE